MTTSELCILLKCSFGEQYTPKLQIQSVKSQLNLSIASTVSTKTKATERLWPILSIGNSFRNGTLLWTSRSERRKKVRYTHFFDHTVWTDEISCRPGQIAIPRFTMGSNVVDPGIISCRVRRFLSPIT